jgi:hypothetical protein
MVSFTTRIEQLNDILAAARPWRIEKLDTDAVIDASLFVRLCAEGMRGTYDAAASSVVPKCPMEMTEARTRDHSASWVKKTGRDSRRMIGISACI